MLKRESQITSLVNSPAEITLTPDDAMNGLAGGRPYSANRECLWGGLSDAVKTFCQVLCRAN